MRQSRLVSNYESNHAQITAAKLTDAELRFRLVPGTQTISSPSVMEARTENQISNGCAVTTIELKPEETWRRRRAIIVPKNLWPLLNEQESPTTHQSHKSSQDTGNPTKTDNEQGGFLSRLSKIEGIEFP